MKFTHKISRGSRFNQIYIPKEMETYFDVGDLVEIRLVKKKINLYYSKHLKKLSPFKEKLIKDIFFFLSQLREIDQIFIIGSFLTEKIDYNDIDLLIVVNRSDKGLEERFYNKLIDMFNLRFHILIIQQEKLNYLEKICPLTRSMLYYSISDKKFNLPSNKQIDKNHIKFLLMMPEDILELKVESRIFYDNLRRLITIERFLYDKEEDPREINNELKKLLGDYLFSYLKKNMEINEDIMKKLRNIIKKRLDSISKKIR